MAQATSPRFGILSVMAFSHFLNDMMQSLILAVYPMLKGGFNLSFAQIGFITLSYQITASLLQPIVGIYTDKHPQPFSLVFGMSSTLIGILLLAFAPSYSYILLAAMMIGVGSSVFHPEAARVARIASAGRYGMAQSFFQVGGNTGSAIGPLLVAWIVIPHTRVSVSWFAIGAFVALIILFKISSWYRSRIPRFRQEQHKNRELNTLSKRRVIATVVILLVLIFSKYLYMSSLQSYYMFYIINKFHLSESSAQYMLFLFLFAIALGTYLGGPIGDRIGRKKVIWFSILGIAPFTLMLPYANLLWTGVLTVIIGLIISSAFPAIMVFAQELIPGKFGMISGLFYGFAFGMGGLGAAALGYFADVWGIDAIYSFCSFVPLLGMLAIFLPDIKQQRP